MQNLDGSAAPPPPAMWTSGMPHTQATGPRTAKPLQHLHRGCSPFTHATSAWFLGPHPTLEALAALCLRLAGPHMKPRPKVPASRRASPPPPAHTPATSYEGERGPAPAAPIRATLWVSWGCWPTALSNKRALCRRCCSYLLVWANLLMWGEGRTFGKHDSAQTMHQTRAHRAHPKWVGGLSFAGGGGSIQPCGWTPCVAFRLVVAPLRGPGRSPVLPFARRVAAFCRPLRPVLLLVLFPRSRSPVVGVLGLC